MSSETIECLTIFQSVEFQNLKDYFMNNLSCLVFRRIESISDIGNLVVIVYQTPFTRFEFDTEEKYIEFITKKGIAYDNKNTVFYYDHYSFTSKTVLRGNDPTYGFRDHIFHGDTENIGIFNEEHLIVQEQSSMIRGENRVAYPLPKIGQLVAGYRYDFNIHVYKLWFLCSEQLLHAFSALFTEEIMLVDNGKDIWEQEIVSGESKVNKYGKIMPSLQEQYNDLRELFSGNKLCTNAYRKFTVGCKQNFIADIPLEKQATEILGMPFFERQSDEGLVMCPELEKRFNVIITEPVSTRYVHFYAFLVLVFKFGIFPTENNIPKNLEKDFPNMKFWDVPDFCTYYVNNLKYEEKITIKNYLKI